MFKTVFVVAVFAIVLQGAFSSPVAEVDNVPKPDALPKNVENVAAVVKENKADGETTSSSTTTTTVAPQSTTPKSGASSTEICMLLVQVSSLALVAKHIMF